MHRCLWLGCKRTIGADLAMCGEHWRALPQDFRARIWAAYVPGQSIADASPEYFKVVGEAQQWIRETFAATQDRHDPGRWERLVRIVREKDAARAARRAAATVDGEFES